MHSGKVLWDVRGRRRDLPLGVVVLVNQKSPNSFKKIRHFPAHCEMKVDEIERKQKNTTPVLSHESTREGVAAKRVSIVDLKLMCRRSSLHLKASSQRNTRCSPHLFQCYSQTSRRCFVQHFGSGHYPILVWVARQALSQFFNGRRSKYIGHGILLF